MSDAGYTATLLTPPGVGAIAVIEVRGRDAIQQVQRVARLRGGRAVADLPAAKIAVADLIADGDRIDEGLVLIRRRTPAEAAVEIHCHGSTRVVQRLMTELTACALTTRPHREEAPRPTCGAADADVASALARARTRRGVAFVLSQAAAFNECISQLSEQAQERGPASLLRRLETLLHGKRTADMMLDGVRLALVGPANAGKSTLANRLLRRDRLVVSDEAGTTRDWTEEPAALAGVPITVIDTAGRRTSEHPVEREAIARGKAKSADADVVLLVLDASVPLPDCLPELVAEYAGSVPLITVANKRDLPAAWRLEDCEAGRDPLAATISAATGDGISELERLILAAVGLAGTPEPGPCLLTGRQVQAVERCLRLVQAGRIEAATRLLAAWAADATAPEGPAASE